MWRRLHKQKQVYNTEANKQYHFKKGSNFVYVAMDRTAEFQIDGEDLNAGKAGVHRLQVAGAGAGAGAGRSGHSSNSASTISLDKHGGSLSEDPFDINFPDRSGQLHLQNDIPAAARPQKTKLTLSHLLRVNAHEDRDPKHVAAAVKISFEDIIGEPDRNQYSYDEAWNASQIAYACCRLWCYRLMTLACGVPVAGFWGMIFASLSCCASWCWAPQLKAFQLVVSYARIFVEGFMSCLIEPCCSAFGVYWSRIRVSYQPMKPEQATV